MSLFISTWKNIPIYLFDKRGGDSSSLCCFILQITSGRSNGPQDRGLSTWKPLCCLLQAQERKCWIRKREAGTQSTISIRDGSLVNWWLNLLCSHTRANLFFKKSKQFCSFLAIPDPETLCWDLNTAFPRCLPRVPALSSRGGGTLVKSFGLALTQHPLVGLNKSIFNKSTAD